MDLIDLQTADIKSLEVLIDAKQKAVVNLKYHIEALQKEIDQAKSRLDSWLFKFVTTIALDPKNLDNPENIDKIDYTRLSYEDLSRKFKTMQKEVEKLSTKLKEEKDQITHIKDEIRAREKKYQQEKSNQLEQQYISLYEQDSTMFFRSSRIPGGVVSDPVSIYKIADPIIAACDHFSKDTNLLDLWSAWQVVNEARAISEKQNDANKMRYADGSKKLLNVLCQYMPNGMQGVKFLYEAKDYDGLNKYLQIGLKNPTMDAENFQRDLADLSNLILQITKVDARIYLENADQFKKLSTKAKSIIIEQQAYIDRAEFDLHYIDPNPNSEKVEALRAQLILMKNNIRNFLDADIKFDLEDNIKEFNRIKANIESGTKSLQDPSYDFGFGSGLGMRMQSQKPVIRPE